MQVKTHARADRACHHRLRQAHESQAEQGRSCRLAVMESVVVYGDQEQEQPQERLPNDIRRLYRAIHQAVSLPSANRLEVARLLGTSSLLLKEDGTHLQFGPSLSRGEYRIGGRRGVPKQDVDRLIARGMGRVHRWDVVLGVCTFYFVFYILRLLPRP